MTHPDAGKGFTDADVFTALGIANMLVDETAVEHGLAAVDVERVKVRAFVLLALHSELVERGTLPAGAVSRKLRTIAANPETEGQGVMLRYFADILDQGWPTIGRVS